MTEHISDHVFPIPAGVEFELPGLSVVLDAEQVSGIEKAMASAREAAILGWVACMIVIDSEFGPEELEDHVKRINHHFASKEGLDAAPEWLIDGFTVEYLAQRNHPEAQFGVYAFLD